MSASLIGWLFVTSFVVLGATNQRNDRRNTTGNVSDVGPQQEYDWRVKCRTPRRLRGTWRGEDVVWLRRSTTRSSVHDVGDDVEMAPRLRRQSVSGHKGRSLYFSGRGEVLSLLTSGLHKEVTENSVTLPSLNFTIEVWLRPEGGLEHGVNIVALRDVCRPNSSNGWSFEIRASRSPGQGEGREQRSEARFSFRLMTDRANQVTTLTSHRRYTPGRWSHLAATYDGATIAFYVDGAKVASSRDQRGPMFGQSVAECKSVVVGGHLVYGPFYRGALDRLQLWTTVMTQRDVIESMRGGTVNGSSPFISNNLERQHAVWRRTGVKSPGHVTVDRNTDEPQFGPVVPPCGETVCDDPVTVTSYLYDRRLQRNRMLRYRIVNVMDDAGSRTTVTDEQIARQDDVIRHAFKRYNISWRQEVVNIRNTSLYSRTVLAACRPDDVADGYCQLQCNHTATAYDGGDCVHVTDTCVPRDVGNGVCDVSCNTPNNNWDGGDCCRSEQIENCIDPASPYRRYLSINEYKELLNLTNSDAVNVYFAEWMQSDIIGVATFPWEKEVHTIYGGVVIRPETFGTPNKSLNLVHEFGHVLGLWHVHAGVSEMDCGDPCRETEASLTLGDLCSDTSPTPANGQCRDPDVGHVTDVLDQICGVTEFKNTPYKNYMSYSGNGCADHFSKQQVARMHCYIDLKYGAWSDTRAPSPVIQAPQVFHSTPGSVTIAWTEPLGGVSVAVSHICNQCFEDYSLLQYANASLTSVALDFGDFGPQEATGVPDAVSCSRSVFTPYCWVPHGSSGPCVGDQCTIRLYLEHPVIIRTLSVWFSYIEDDAIESIELVSVDGSSQILESVTPYCDMPYTVEIIGETLTVNQVVVRGRNSNFALDAIAVRSEENSAICKRCPQLRYHINRDPPFTDKHGANKSTVITEDLIYTDSSVKYNQTYAYSVRASLGTHVQQIGSPVLQYTHGQSFCGDGRVDKDEECDDGNHRHGDGCSRHCSIEESFTCKGSPSLCYRYYGDGVCEPFELANMNSVLDCGHVTPPGYTDTWVSGVLAGSRLDGVPGSCRPEVVLGPPNPGPYCHLKYNTSLSWRPECLNRENRISPERYYLMMSPPEPVITSAVIVYLSTDRPSLRQDYILPVLVNISLIHNDNHTSTVHSGVINITCTMTGYVLPVTHPLTVPLRKTKAVQLEFDSSKLDIYAVAFRTSHWVQHTVYRQCDGDSYYDGVLNRCVTAGDVCEQASCGRAAVKHGDVTCNGHMEGRTCHVTCKEGYKLAGNEDHLTCTNGTWIGDVHCVPVDCGTPRLPHAVMDCPDGTTVNNKCKFDCISPARKQGTSHVLVCQPDGLWSLPEGYCRVFCSPITRVKNCTLVTTSCASGTQELGTTCRMRCLKGFRVKNEEEIRRNYELVCTADGQWQGGSCVRIQCTPLSKLYAGTYSCTDSFNAGSMCTVKCPGPHGVTSHLKCLRSAVWNKSPDRCSVDHVTCPSIPAVSRAGILTECENFTPGSTCRLTCQHPDHDIMDTTSGYTDDVSGRHLTSLCTYSGVWLPSITEVKCLPKCDQHFIGDGFCDPDNNQGRCQWDGGDCCLSTSSSGFVTSCGPGCMCKDPNAAENRDVVNRARRHHHRTAVRVRHGLNSRKWYGLE